MTRYAARKGKLLKETTQPPFILTNLRVTLGVGTLQIAIRYDGRSAVTRTGNKDGVETVLDNEPVRVRIDEIQSRCGSPMTNRPWFDVIPLQRAPQ